MFFSVPSGKSYPCNRRIPHEDARNLVDPVIRLHVRWVGGIWSITWAQLT